MSQTPKPIDPMTVDFAALRVLRMVHAHGSFSRAAEALHVSQPSISYTIDRLRQVFGDPLFVRQGARIVTTDRCDEIAAQAAQMVDEFAALSEPRGFDPAAANATITVSCNFYERVTMVPALIRTLRADAPGLKLNILSSTVRGGEQLSRGEADLVIGPMRFSEEGFFGRKLLTDHYACVMDPSHPLAARPLLLADYLAAPAAVVTYGGSWRSAYLMEIEAMGATLNTVLEVPSPASLPDLLRGTDLIATVPFRIANSYGPGVTIRDCPVNAPIDIGMFWTARTNASPMHKWLRALVGTVVANLC